MISKFPLLNDTEILLEINKNIITLKDEISFTNFLQISTSTFLNLLEGSKKIRNVVK